MTTEFIPATCPSCNGELRVPSNLVVVKCLYCGKEVILSNANNDPEQPLAEKLLQNSDEVKSTTLVSKSPPLPTNSFSRKNVVGIVLIVCIVGIAIGAKPLLAWLQINVALHDLVQKDILPSSKYLISYSLTGSYGREFNVTLSDNFDNLQYKDQWSELNKINDKYNVPRQNIIKNYGENIYKNLKNEHNHNSKINARTSNNIYEFFSATSKLQINNLYRSISTETLLSKPGINYTLINIDKGHSTKCIMDVRLSNRIPEDEIKYVAEHISKNEGVGCSPLYIFYFINDDKPGIDMAWAYSHFNPKLVIKINGLDLKTEATLEANIPTADENVIGVWLNTGVLSSKIEIKKINGTYQMTTVFADGSGETKTLSVKVVNGEERLYENLDNYYGDYMVIKKNGDLAFYDNKGLIYELKPYN